MAITAAALTSGSSTTAATSYTTASVTPGANRLLLLAVAGNWSGVNTAPTITGNGLTWVQVGFVEYDTSGTRCGFALFRAMGASPTAGTITINYGANAQGSCNWHLLEFDGVDTGGTNGSAAIVQSLVRPTTPPSASATGDTGTLSAFGSASNMGVGFWVWEAAEQGTAGASLTKLPATNSTISGPSQSVMSAYGVNQATLAGTWTTAAQWGSIYVEVKASGSTTSPAGLASASGSALQPTVTTGAPIIQQGRWRWLADVAAPTAGDALAAEETAPTLSQAQLENGIVRLRVQLREIGGGADTKALNVQYSEDDTNWQNIASATPAGDTEVFWARWVDGASTAGAAVSSQLLTGTTTSGTYVENTGTVTVPASSTTEFDLALRVHWPPPSTTIRFRVTWNGTPLALDAGRTQIQLVTPGPSLRGHTIDRLTAISGIIRNQENRFAPDRRVFWVDTYQRWFFFTGDGSETPSATLRYYTWSGSGAWSAPTTFTVGSGALTATLHKTYLRKVADGEHVVLVVTRQSSGTRYWRRGRVTSATAITWDTGESNTYYSDRHVAVSMDDGYRWWIGGIDAVAGGVWGACAVNADGGASGWSGGFGTRHAAAASGVASGDLIGIYGLGAGKAMFVWANATGGSLQYALCDASTGFGTVRTLAATAHPNDWGVVRAGGWLYCLHTDSVTDSSGSWVFKAYQESDDATGFAVATSPSQSHVSAGGNDGLPLARDGDDVYAFAVWAGFEGGQDRKLVRRKYTGPGRSGAWGALTNVTDAGGRTNFDYNLVSEAPGAGQIVSVTLAGDDAMLGTQFALEYHVTNVPVLAAAGVAAASAVALAPTVSAASSTLATAGLAAGAAPALAPVARVARTVAAVAAVVAGPAPASSVRVNAGVAAGVAGAPAPATSVRAAAGLAAAAAVAPQPTVSTASSAQANAGLAGATAAAPQPSVVAHGGLATPTRGAFYYPWFPETWTVGGQPTKFTPSLGTYDYDGAGAAAVIDQHLAWLAKAGIKLLVLSWWAQDDGNAGTTGTDHNEGTRIPLILSRIVATGSPIKVAMYYESEGFGDPTVTQLQSDLAYIGSQYSQHPAYLWRAGKPVIFVYNSGDTSGTNCLQRWSDAGALSSWYVVMKVFSGYATATPAPDSWHQYGPASRTSVHAPYSYVVSPGYWQANDPDPPGGEFPYLARDADDFAAAVRGMVAATSTEWHLVTTFNEWGEGTAIEPSTAYGTAYVDILSVDGLVAQVAAATAAAPTPTVSARVNAGVAAAAAAAPAPTATTSSGASANAGPATATTSAPAATSSVRVSAGLAGAVATAPAVTASAGPRPAVDGATAAAPAPATSVRVAAGLASASGTTPAATVSTSSQAQAPAGVASSAGAAPTATGSARANAGLAAGAGSAPAATVSTAASTQAPAGLAAAAAAAPGPVASVRVTAGLASATAAAPQPSASTVARTSAPAGLASATATAPSAAVTVFAAAGLAAAAGTAPAVAISAAARAAVAVTVVSALDPAGSVRAATSTAAAAGTAPAVSGYAFAEGRAPAGVASAAAVAPAPRTAVRATAGIASATGVAGQPAPITYSPAASASSGTAGRRYVRLGEREVPRVRSTTRGHVEVASV